MSAFLGNLHLLAYSSKNMFLFACLFLPEDYVCVVDTGLVDITVRMMDRPEKVGAFFVS